MKKKKWMMMAVMVLALTMMFGTTVYASGKGDVAGAIEGTWQDASAQIKTVVNKVVFPAIDLILAVFFFAKLGTAYFDYRKHGQFEWAAPAILFACQMFIFDFVAETVLDQIIDWLYGKIVGFLNDFFAMMNNMGVELFDLPWVNAITTFFSWLGWALFVVGLVVGAFECAIEYQGGRGSIKDTALNYVKGFMAVSLFSILPVNLYSLSVSLQSSFGSALSGITDAESIGMTAQQVLMSAAMPGVGNPILQIFCAVMMGYAVIKVFFGNLKRGGILLIQIAVGSLYMFSVPRGYIDGFTQWCKQVIGICLTAFLQSTMLTAGLMIFKDHPLLGLGVMQSSTEVPRIAGQFGLDTSTKANLMSGVYAAQTAINISKTVVKAVAA